ncbi:hypothetical protein [Streptomyces sp. NPDC048057]|uniref:hypothetical protein n=1 Tax=Streptomyces sp. NPDC048057 TaxID=3155628 RepID=UPI0033DBB892
MPSIDEIKKFLSDECAQEIMDIASFGGITYWAIEPTAEERRNFPRDKRWIIVEGFDDSFTGEERSVDGVHFLNEDDLRGAYAKLLDLDQEYVGREYHGYIVESWMDRTDKYGIETGIIDAGMADAIVQVAIFDEVRYG